MKLFFTSFFMCLFLCGDVVISKEKMSGLKLITINNTKNKSEFLPLDEIRNKQGLKIKVDLALTEEILKLKLISLEKKQRYFLSLSEEEKLEYSSSRVKDLTQENNSEQFYEELKAAIKKLKNQIEIFELYKSKFLIEPDKKISLYLAL